MSSKNWTDQEKLQIVLEGIKEQITIDELCNKYGIDQAQYYEWRNQLIENGSKVFQMNTFNNELIIKFAPIYQRILANIIDIIIIIITSMIFFFPISAKMDELGVNGWIPFFVFGGLYFLLFESIFPCQTIGRMIFSLHLTDASGHKLRPWKSVFRYLCWVFPNYNQEIGNLIGQITGLTNFKIWWVFYLLILGVMCSGNIIFAFFHKQKRSLYDIFSGSFLLKKKVVKIEQPLNFTYPSLIAGITFFILLSLVALISWGMFMRISNNNDIKKFNDRIKSVSSIKSINVGYESSTSILHGQSEKQLKIQIHVYIPYLKNTRDYCQTIADELFPKIKSQNQNSKVTDIEIIFYSQKYIGLFWYNKIIKISENISEISIK